MRSRRDADANRLGLGQGGDCEGERKRSGSGERGTAGEKRTWFSS